MSGLLGIRLNTFNENFLNESDHDANSALTELDKGLRSSKIGDQCEAIVRFPKLFEKYPFPILINSSFLKLADFFRNGSNLLRVWVLRVCQQSEKHLDKILSVDEFVKRIAGVMHSNDPVARSLTLRTLGAVAGVIPEKQQIHHAIREALDSHDSVEVEAAIQASVQFAAQSKTFAVSMCSKIASMIESLQTPVRMKLQLIPVLRHMHHDANTAALVKTLCVQLLPKYPSREFVVVILDSLTYLSRSTLVDIPDQVKLLLEYIQDPRKRVRVQVLRSLNLLAKEGAHLWPQGAFKSLLINAMASKDPEQSLALSIVLQLSNCSVTCYNLLKAEQPIILELCTSCLVLDKHTTASQAICILTTLINYCHVEKCDSPELYWQQINLHLESLILTALMDAQWKRELSRYCKSGVRLSEIDNAFGCKFLKLIGGVLSDGFVYPTETTLLLCETMAALGTHFYRPIGVSLKNEAQLMEVDGVDVSQVGPFQSLLPHLMRKLEHEAIAKEKTVEIMAAVCLQTLLDVFMPRPMLASFDRILKVANNDWTNYRIARSASRYGQHYFAARLYQNLASTVSIEKLHYFLICMSQISLAECVLIHGIEFNLIEANYDKLATDSDDLPQMTLSERLSSAVTMYWKALSNLRASSSPSHPYTFQAEFIRLRAQYLEVLLQLVNIKHTHTLTPPPAIAQSLAQNSRDHLLKFGHVTNQLRKAVKLIKTVEESYGKLYKTAFDADPCTLELIQLTQKMCSIIGFSLETICFVTPTDVVTMTAVGKYPETKSLAASCRRVLNELTTLPAETATSKTITDQHTEMLINQIEMITKTPICLPRFFFQVLQNTSIKLSISPPPRPSGDPVTVQAGSNLVVKVEGVVQHFGQCPSLYRRIDSVQLTLTSQLTSQSAAKSNDFKSCLNSGDTITLTQIVKPHRDFLSGSFLLPLNTMQHGQFGPPVSVGGQWQVTLEAFVIDEHGHLWNTGPKTSLLVRVPDDPTKQANGMGSARRF